MEAPPAWEQSRPAPLAKQTTPCHAAPESISDQDCRCVHPCRCNDKWNPGHASTAAANRWNKPNTIKASYHAPCPANTEHEKQETTVLPNIAFTDTMIASLCSLTRLIWCQGTDVTSGSTRASGTTPSGYPLKTHDTEWLKERREGRREAIRYITVVNCGLARPTANKQRLHHSSHHHYHYLTAPPLASPPHAVYRYKMQCCTAVCQAHSTTPWRYCSVGAANAALHSN
ncbi:hypothetical protein E2C01_018894 [Portunus trituberculatus]|uniref:Uncharacterized protein n=1 Tax=Portunus trituberculatus TaxID=210409 RepID=A0A5B7DVS2_PORTR|nr:hypothetical protein [Portunus trituberculatus]